MKKITFLLLWICYFSASGCTSITTQPRPDSYYQGLSYEATSPDSGSLFSTDDEVLSDENIKTILSHRFVPQTLNRICILPLGQMYWYGWSYDLDRANEAVQNTLIEKLRSTPSVYDASYLPTLLIPEEKTIGHLRQAAARYQSDFLLVYHASFQTYQKYRLFSPDKSKAYCNLEAVLLDTRTGIVPFTILVSRTYTADELKTDMNFHETIRKAQLSALESALSEVGDKVAEFLSH
jgi:hypothetical protein